jgi:hypothetical protein
MLLFNLTRVTLDSYENHHQPTTNPYVSRRKPLIRISLPPYFFSWDTASLPQTC